MLYGIQNLQVRDGRVIGVSKNRGPLYSTLNSRILIIRTPNIRPYFRKLPYRVWDFINPKP